MSYRFSDRELATIFAALRYWQREGTHSSGIEHDIASNCDTLTPISTSEIDALCDRLNGRPKVVIEVSGGVAECTECPSDVDVEIIDHDNEEAEAEEAREAI